MKVSFPAAGRRRMRPKYERSKSSDDLFSNIPKHVRSMSVDGTIPLASYRIARRKGTLQIAGNFPTIDPGEATGYSHLH